MRSRVAHILLAALLPAAALAQGVPTNDSGLTARDIVETGDRDADLAVQREKLTVEELLTEIEREQLATLRAILRAAREGANRNPESGMELETELFTQVSETFDMKEGASAFLEKRPPTYRDC